MGRVGAGNPSGIVLGYFVQIVFRSFVVPVLEQDGQSRYVMMKFMAQLPLLVGGLCHELVTVDGGFYRGVLVGLPLDGLHRAQGDDTDDQHQDDHGPYKEREDTIAWPADAQGNLIEKKHGGEKEARSQYKPFPDAGLNLAVKGAADEAQYFQHGIEQDHGGYESG